MPLRVKRTDSLGLPSWPTVRALYVEKARKLPSKLGLLLAVGAYGAPYMACHRMNGSPSRTAAGRGSGGSGPQRAFFLEEAPPLAAGFFTLCSLNLWNLQFLGVRDKKAVGGGV